VDGLPARVAIVMDADAMTPGPTVRRWVTTAACVWALLFAAPHTWWALGFPWGFPGGEANHHLMMTTWRYPYDVIVILLSFVAILISLTLQRPPEAVSRRWVPHSAAWIACGMLTLRGLAGLVVDGASDPIWWPTFLIGGMLLGAVAWLARVPNAVREHH